MVSSLKGYEIIKGYRGQKGINIQAFIDILVRVSAILNIAPEIMELDLNPLIAFKHNIISVDARIRIEKLG